MNHCQRTRLSRFLSPTTDAHMHTYVIHHQWKFRAYLMLRMIIHSTVGESISERAVHGAVDTKGAFARQPWRWMGMRTVDDTVHRHRSSGCMIERPAGIVDGLRAHRRVLDWPTRWLFNRRPTGMLLVEAMLQHPRYVLHGPASMIVHPAKVMVVHVTRVILEPARMLYRAQRVVLDPGPHRRGRHGRRRGGMLDARSRLLRAYLLFHRPGHRLERPARLMVIDGGPHRIGRRLPYHRVDGSHRLHRPHRLGRAHAVLDRPHRRRIRRSARSAPASRYGVRAVAHVTPIPTSSDTSGSTADTMTLSRPTDRVRIHFHLAGNRELGVHSLCPLASLLRSLSPHGSHR